MIIEMSKPKGMIVKNFALSIPFSVLAFFFFVGFYLYEKWMKILYPNENVKTPGENRIITWSRYIAVFLSLPFILLFKIKKLFY